MRWANRDYPRLGIDWLRLVRRLSRKLDMAWLMFDLGKTINKAADKFASIFGRRPDTINVDHNHIWVGDANEDEVSKAEASGKVRFIHIYDRPVTAKAGSVDKGQKPKSAP